jgi:hypothetical protein
VWYKYKSLGGAILDCVWIEQQKSDDGLEELMDANTAPFWITLTSEEQIIRFAMNVCLLMLKKGLKGT